MCCSPVVTLTRFLFLTTNSSNYLLVQTKGLSLWRMLPNFGYSYTSTVSVARAYIQFYKVFMHRYPHHKFQFYRTFSFPCLISTYIFFIFTVHQMLSLMYLSSYIVNCTQFPLLLCVDIPASCSFAIRLASCNSRTVRPVW